MRVFHFLDSHYGLKDIAKRHLKISCILDLNDPFELLGYDISDRHNRREIFRIKKDISNKYGLICFSKSWSNPVQWSHYANRHKGICLGFDVPDELLFKVDYASKKLKDKFNSIANNNEISETEIKSLLSIKYHHWHYEQEVRWLVDLKDKSKDGFYYKKFSQNLILKQVIVGAYSKISRQEITDVLKGNSNHVEVFKSRPAFKSFRVVRNRNESLWA